MRTKADIVEYLNIKREDAGYCSLDGISEILRMTVICTEDKRFYRHFGFDFVKIIQAAYVDVLERKKVLGASTITQQLAKNVYFSFRKTFSRKAAELLMACKIEHKLKKDDILELYFNIIYYGQEKYGIADACRHYFNKLPSQISLNEAITLSSLLPAPSNYNPVDDAALFKKARRLALIKMIKHKMISAEEAEIFANAAYDEDFSGTGDECVQVQEIEKRLIEKGMFLGRRNKR